MAARHRMRLPALSLGLLVKLWERRIGKAGGQNERDILHGVGLPAELDGLLKRAERLHGALAIHPLQIAGIDVEDLGGNGRDPPAFSVTRGGLHLHFLLVGRQRVVQALAVLQNECIQVYKSPNAIGDALRYSTDHATAVGVAAKNYVRKFL